MRYLLLVLALSILGGYNQDFALEKYLHNLRQHFQELQDREYQLGKKPDTRKLLLSPPNGSFYRTVSPNTVSAEVIATYYPGLRKK